MPETPDKTAYWFPCGESRWDVTWGEWSLSTDIPTPRKKRLHERLVERTRWWLSDRIEGAYNAVSRVADWWHYNNDLHWKIEGLIDRLRGLD